MWVLQFPIHTVLCPHGYDTVPCYDIPPRYDILRVTTPFPGLPCYGILIPPYDTLPYYDTLHYFMGWTRYSISTVER
jgi:hypothetical protein